MNSTLTILRRFFPFNLPRIALLLIVAAALFVGTCASAEPAAPKADDPHLLLWLDAADAGTLGVETDGHVAAWANKAKQTAGKFTSSGKQRPLYVEQALGGRPTLRFDGVDDILRNPQFGRAVKTWSLFLVATPRSNKGNGQFHGFFSTNKRNQVDFVSGMNVDLGPNETAWFSELNFESAKDDPGVRSLRTEASNFGEGQVLVLVTGAERTQLYVGEEAENMRFAGDASNSLEEVRIGGRYYAGAERGFLDGDISEVLFYDAALGDAERVALTEYLAEKYDCASRKIVYSYKDAWPALKKYDGFGSRLALTPIDQAIQKSHGDAAKRQEIERRLIAVLESSDSTQAAKEFACRRLIFVGTAESGPALAKHLADPQLGYVAQITLQAISGEASVAAIRKAVEKAPQARQLSLIQSLGMLRDKKAVPMLAKLLKSLNSDVAEAAAQSLAQIGDVDCVAPLGEFLQKANPERKSLAYWANLALANRLLEKGYKEEIAKILITLDPLAENMGETSAVLTAWCQARPEYAVQFLQTMLSDKNPRIRGIAAGLVRMKKNREIIDQLAEHFADISRAGQLLFLDAVALQDQEWVTVIAKKAWASKDSTIRAAAISYFRGLSDELGVPKLIQVAAKAETATEKEAAFRSLTQMRGESIDAAMIDQLKQAEAPLRVLAIRVLAARQSFAAFEDLAKAAEDADPAVRAEVGKALQALANEKAVGRLVQLLLEAASDGERSLFEQALIASCMKIDDTAKRAEPILAEYARAKPEGQEILLPVLGAVGGKQASDFVHAALKDSKSKLYASGIRALSNWPDASVVPEVLDLANSETDPARRSWEIRGIARVAPRPGQMPPPEAFAAMKQAFELADRLEDKKLVLTRMGAIRTPDCLAFAAAKIDDPEMQTEALATTVKLAEGMKESHPREAKAAFERVLAVTKDDTLRTRIQRLIGKIKP